MVGESSKACEKPASCPRSGLVRISPDVLELRTNWLTNVLLFLVIVVIIRILVRRGEGGCGRGNALTIRPE
jgi:hypothetical protein